MPSRAGTHARAIRKRQVCQLCGPERARDAAALLPEAPPLVPSSMAAGRATSRRTTACDRGSFRAKRGSDHALSRLAGLAPRHGAGGGRQSGPGARSGRGTPGMKAPNRQLPQAQFTSFFTGRIAGSSELSRKFVGFFRHPAREPGVSPHGWGKRRSGIPACAGMTGLVGTLAGDRLPAASCPGPRAEFILSDAQAASKGRGVTACGGRHFTLTGKSLYTALPVSAGYGDKLQCAIDAADPGAVPGGSTTKAPQGVVLTGPNQDRRVLKSAVFARPECAVKPFKTTSANDNEALALAA